MEHNPQLATVCFMLGVVALLWVFRRTLLRSRSPAQRDDSGSFRTRALTAEAEIDDISARAWLATWRSALKFERAAAGLTPQQQAHLAALSAWQASHRRNKDG